MEKDIFTRFTKSRHTSYGKSVWFLGAVLLVAMLLMRLNVREAVFAHDDEPDTSWLNQTINTIDGIFPLPWACSGAAPASQSILEFHRNWHCNNPDNNNATWGNRFLGFHKQFLDGYNRYRAANGFSYIQTWVAAPGAPIPIAHGGRPSNTPCTSCIALPNTFQVPSLGGTLNLFTSENAIGSAVVSWHNINHGRIAIANGPTDGIEGAFSDDMNYPAVSPRDPIFYRYHNLFNDIQDAWRTMQPTDIFVVFDRSGSMSLPASGSGSRLDAAKNAANLFADLLENNVGHRVGLVTFATTASAPADLSLTSVDVAPAAMNTALSNVTAGGSTSIGAGLQQAQMALAAAPGNRKAILLLTDGMENTAPTIANAQSSLSDTHVCSVGFGTPGSLDGPKLRDLSEEQGGIYISGPNPLELRKFFVTCFADIFDEFIGTDPIQILPAGQLASDPLIHNALSDEKVTFVLSWAEPIKEGALSLEITAPSGKVVDLVGRSIESSQSDLWHLARINLPLAGEGDGEWQARAVRTPTLFVNGFTSDSFVDPAQGVAMVTRQLRDLCPGGCTNVLYYEDEFGHHAEDAQFMSHYSVYADALYMEVAQGTVTNITRVRDAEEFASLLHEVTNITSARNADEFVGLPKYDLLVYSSKVAEQDQPYDGILADLLCSQAFSRAVLSDNRGTSGALQILECAGVKPTGNDNWESFETLLAPEGVVKLMPPTIGSSGPFSVGLEPVREGVSEVANAESGSSASLAAVIVDQDIEFFISALTRAPGRVSPSPWISNYYTGEQLHPTFHIPEPYWPAGGYDEVRARVQVERPLRSIGSLVVDAGLQEGIGVEGDFLGVRALTSLTLDPEQTGDFIPTEILEFKLFDDGSNGDNTANDRYWEAALPADIAKFDGEYVFHAFFDLCNEDVCVQREAMHTVVVDVKISPANSDVSVRNRNFGAQGNITSVISIVPRDDFGNLPGIGLEDSLLMDVSTGATITNRLSFGDVYSIWVEWNPNKEPPIVSVHQFGRPKEGLEIRIGDFQTSAP